MSKLSEELEDMVDSLTFEVSSDLYNYFLYSGEVILLFVLVALKY